MSLTSLKTTLTFIEPRTTVTSPERVYTIKCEKKKNNNNNDNDNK